MPRSHRIATSLLGTLFAAALAEIEDTFGDVATTADIIELPVH